MDEKRRFEKRERGNTEKARRNREKRIMREEWTNWAGGWLSCAQRQNHELITAIVTIMRYSPLTMSAAGQTSFYRALLLWRVGQEVVSTMMRGDTDPTVIGHRGDHSCMMQKQSLNRCFKLLIIILLILLLLFCFTRTNPERIRKKQCIASIF